MISIKPSQIPAHLRDSAFCRSLTENAAGEEEELGADEPFSIPESYMKIDLNIDSPADVRHLLSTLRF